MKVAIIGAGPAGLTIAHQLSANNVEVDVIESGKTVGGFAKTIELWGKKIEIGPHFLSIGRLQQVEHLIEQNLKGHYTTYNRKTFILTKNKLFSYPPSPANMVSKLNLFESVSLAVSILFLKPASSNGHETAESFVRTHLGGYLYKYFFENFSHKLWGVTGKHISPQFAKSLLGFSKGFSPFKILYRQIFKGRNLKDVYIYPKGGLSTLWERIKINTEQHGGRFLLNTQIKEVISAPSAPGQLSHLVFEDGTTSAYDHFIFTIPMEHIIQYLPKEETATALLPTKYRADILLYLKVTYDTVVDGQCFYVYEKSNRITRITNFSKFNEDADNDFSIVLLEFWCGTMDDIWGFDKQTLWDMAVTELEKTKIFSGLKIHDADVKKVERAFQVPDLDYLSIKEKLLEQLLPWQNLVVTGRTASVNFNYGMENAMDDGINIANNIISNHQHKLQLEKA